MTGTYPVDFLRKLIVRVGTTDEYYQNSNDTNTTIFEGDSIGFRRFDQAVKVMNKVNFATDINDTTINNAVYSSNSTGDGDIFVNGILQPTSVGRFNINGIDNSTNKVARNSIILVKDHVNKQHNGILFT